MLFVENDIKSPNYKHNGKHYDGKKQVSNGNYLRYVGIYYNERSNGQQ